MADQHPATSPPTIGEVTLLCTFRLAGRWFGVDARWVKEINTQTSWTPIPQAPAVVRGFVNLRGHLHLVLDLRELLAPEGDGTTLAGHLIVFKSSAGEAMALSVDEVGEIVAVSPDDFDASRAPDDVVDASTSSAGSARLVVGIAKLSAHLVTVVDPRQFLAIVSALIE